MADGGYLAPPSEDPSKEKLWVETRKRLERFLPDLFAEIFPNNLETPQPQPAVPPTTTTTTATTATSTDSSAEKAVVSPTAATPEGPADERQQPGSPTAGEDDLD